MQSILSFCQRCKPTTATGARACHRPLTGAQSWLGLATDGYAGIAKKKKTIKKKNRLPSCRANGNRLARAMPPVCTFPTLEMKHSTRRQRSGLRFHSHECEKKIERKRIKPKKAWRAPVDVTRNLPDPCKRLAEADCRYFPPKTLHSFVVLRQNKMPFP